MPVYEYACEKCKGQWETVLPISQRDTPLAAACPQCKKRKCVRRGVSVCTMGVDATKGPGSEGTRLQVERGSGHIGVLHRNVFSRQETSEHGLGGRVRGGRSRRGRILHTQIIP